MMTPLSLTTDDGWKITLAEEDKGMTVALERGPFRMWRVVSLSDAQQVHDWVGALLAKPR